MFEVLEHTADVGLRVRAADLNALFAEAARGLFSLMVENGAEEVASEIQHEVALKASNLEDLLHDWLSELLYQFEVQHRVLGRFDVQVEGTSLRASVAGQKLDRSRHGLLHEVKAVTYHRLSVRQQGTEWEVEVILDI
jgi:SHS2 domain-containing protein